MQTALVALTRVAPSVTGSAEAISLIAMGFANLAEGRDGREACVRARAAPALVALALLPVVKLNADAAWNVARVSCPAAHSAFKSARATWVLTFLFTITRPQALLALAETDNGRTACVAAGAVAALEALAAQPAVQANMVVAAALEDALRKVRSEACCAVQ